MRYFKIFAFGISVGMLISCKNNEIKEPGYFHAGASHSGYYNTSGVKILHGVKWSYKTSAKVFSSPVISGNKVFIGSDDSSVYSIDAKDGRLFWKFKTGGKVRSSAAVSDDKVLVMSSNGLLYCIDQESGKQVWTFTTSGEHVFAAKGLHGAPQNYGIINDPWDMFLSSPVIANGIVYFGCGSGTFYALDCNSGKEKWEFETKGVIHSSPAYSDSTIFFGSWDSYMYALNSATGTLKWKFKTGIDTVYYNQVGFQSSPVVYKGVIYSGCRDANIWAIDEKTGQLKWKFFNNGSWVIVTPALHNDTLYFTTSDTHKFIALNASDGKQLYSGNCSTFGFSSPAVTDGIVYLGNFGGSLMAFRSKNGELLWEFKTESARIDKDSLIAGNGEFNFPRIFKENTYQGMLNAMDILYSLGSVLSSPAVANGVVYFGSTDGNIYALN